MRPVELVMQGFGPFRDPVTVDFADAELIAIVGPTGHGKSSIIDAICFALYGRVPRHDNNIAPVITLGAAEARVALTFMLGSHRYVASRVVRRKPDGSGAAHRAVRLERIDPDGSTEVLAGAVGEFDAKMRGLVGLDFDQFTKCVVLPQGRFAAFLQATSGERGAILGALLGLGRYERMAKAARERGGELKGLREALEQERGRAVDLDGPALEAQRQRRDALAVLVDDIETARDADARRTEQIEERRRESVLARAVITALVQVRVDPKVAPLARAITEATEARDAIATAADAAEIHATELANALEQLPQLEVLTSALEAHDGHEKLEVRIANGLEIEARLLGEAAVARDALVAAHDAVAAAELASDAATRKHAHAELRAALVAGEPCPVCEQVVNTVPPKLSTAAATKVRKELDAARKGRSTAETKAAAVIAEQKGAEAQLGSLRERQVEFEAKIATHPDRVRLEAVIADVRARREAAQMARAEVARNKDAVGTANRHVAEAAKKLEAGEQAFQGQRDALLGVGLTPPSALDAELMTRWNALAAFAADQRAEEEKRAARIDDERATLTAERDTVFANLRTRATGAGADASADALPELALAVTGAHRDAVHVVERAETQLARAAELDRDVRAAADEEQVAKTLGRLLDRGHFSQWIADEALRGLVDGASVVLRQLSSGQYSLAVTSDGNLLVVDHVNADETRSVNSLSGGETFQASLALALALADRVSELAADSAEPLESIFLDEGFGSLDPETLDVVAGTIESLARDDRVVGVVTHVRELAERMPVRLRVRKESGTSTVTREES